MSEPVNTWIEGPSGPVNSGNGDQHNHFTIGTSLRDTGVHNPRRIAEDQLRWLRQRFVDPQGMGEARHLLSDTGTVILDGAHGSGRTAAARVLLHELHRDTGIFRELRPGEEEQVDLKDPGLVGAGDRLLLDLADANVARWAQTRADLPALRRAVCDQQAHLVVVMPHGRELESDLRAYCADIGRPPDEEVFRRHLLLHGLPPEDYLHAAPALVEFLNEQPPMEEIAHFADRVHRARVANRARDGFATWCQQARDARKEWRQEVTEAVSSRREAPHRALLFVTAMLHGAHADVIHHSAALLLRILKTPPDESPLLERQDLAERLTEISAAAGADGHVRFGKPDYDIAVRAHFWDHMPDLRDHLGDWAVRSMEELPDPHVTPALRKGLVEGLADQYLRTGRWRELASLAESWSDTTRSRVRLEAAVHALTCGLERRQFGGEFRQLIRTWSADKPLTAGLAYVLIRVCTDAIAPSYPDQAVVRLHHLARRERGSSAAEEALCELVATSNRLRRLMLDRLTRPSSPTADMHLFLRICDPQPLSDPGSAPRALIDEKAVQDCVTAGWKTVLDDDPPQVHWQPYAENWLHTASTLTRRGDLLLDLLVDAAGQNGRKLAALYTVARAAEPATPGGRARGAATTDLLLRKISAAQGLHPPAAPPRPEPPRGTTP